MIRDFHIFWRQPETALLPIVVEIRSHLRKVSARIFKAGHVLIQPYQVFSLLLRVINDISKCFTEHEKTIRLNCSYEDGENDQTC